MFMAATETCTARWTGIDWHQGSGHPRLLIVTHETLGERLAGPGIRCWELAKVPSDHYTVVVAAPRGFWRHDGRWLEARDPLSAGFTRRQGQTSVN
jgi:hypothetical protein